MSSLPNTHPEASPYEAAMPPVSAVLLQIVGVVMRWELRRLTRRGLTRLDDHLLKDIGLDRSTAESEIAKPFWRA